MIGPGLMAVLADTDAGSIVPAAQSGARWGYGLLPLELLLIPVPWHYLFLAAANVGAVIMPWMIFYQQAAVLDKGLTSKVSPRRGPSGS